jgi:hypothetical protein
VIAIGQAIGRMIKCPECGRPAQVRPSQERVLMHDPRSNEIVSSSAWVLVDCKFSGKKLYRREDPAELIEASHV